MPTPTIKKFAKEYHLPVEKVENLWEKAKRIALHKFKESSEHYYPYVMGIIKRMLGEDNLKEKASYKEESFSTPLLNISLDIFRFLLSNYAKLKQVSNIRTQDLISLKHLIVSYKATKIIENNQYLDASFILYLKSIIRSILEGKINNSSSEIRKLESYYKALSRHQIRYSKILRELVLQDNS